MKTNETLQKDVQDAMKWEPLLNQAQILVSAKDGIITLTGVVNDYAKKSLAENAAKNISGVKAVVEKIEIEFDSSFHKSDNEIAIEIVNNFNWRQLPNDKVKVKVEDGWVTLEGELHWNYQREIAKSAVIYVMGVKGITNNITLKSATHDEVEKKDIEDAYARNWSLHDQNIQVNVLGTKVVLSGTVSSLYQKEEAAQIAWNVPGVSVVDNQLVVLLIALYA